MTGLSPPTAQALDAALAIEEERAAVAHPVGGFEASVREIGDAAIGGIDRQWSPACCRERASPALPAEGWVNSTFEKTAFSTTSLSCEQTPRPT